MPVRSASEAWRMCCTSARDSSLVIHVRFLPLRAPGKGELAIEGQGGFQRDEGFLRGDPAGESFIEFFRFRFKEAGIHCDARGTQACEASAARLRIGILRRGNNAGDSCGDDRLGTGARAPGVIARLEGDEEGGSTRAFSSLLKRDDFRVVAPVVLMEALAEDRAILHNDAADGGVGAGEADALAR